MSGNLYEAIDLGERFRKAVADVIIRSNLGRCEAAQWNVFSRMNPTPEQISIWKPAPCALSHSAEFDELRAAYLALWGHMPGE